MCKNNKEGIKTRKQVLGVPATCLSPQTSDFALVFYGLPGVLFTDTEQLHASISSSGQFY